MLFTENQLYSINPFDVLDECMYLTEEESNINPTTIPIKENSRIGYGVVRFNDIDALAESYGVDYIDAMYILAESNNIDPNDIAISIPEEDIIAYPELVNEVSNIVIEPINENDIEVQFVYECVDSYVNTGNEEYLEMISEVSTPPNELNQKSANLFQKYGTDMNEWPDAIGKSSQTVAKNSKKDDVNFPIINSPDSKNKNKKKNADTSPGFFKRHLKSFGSAIGKHKAVSAAIAGTAAAVLGGGIYAYKQYKNKPKSVIGKRIAALRNIYRKYMLSAQKNPSKAGIFKKIAAKILSVIDKLMGYLQNAAG